MIILEDYNSGCGARDKLLNKRTGTNTATGPLSNYCCTPNNPCRKEEGECRTDDSCMGGLVCGSDNCPQPFKTCCQKRRFTYRYSQTPTLGKFHVFFQENHTTKHQKIKSLALVGTVAAPLFINQVGGQPLVSWVKVTVITIGNVEAMQALTLSVKKDVKIFLSTAQMAIGILLIRVVIMRANDFYSSL